MLSGPEEPSASATSAAAAGLPQVSTGAPGGFVVERPPPGLARGRYAASPLTIALLGAALLFVTLGYFFRLWRRTRA